MVNKVNIIPILEPSRHSTVIYAKEHFHRRLQATKKCLIPVINMYVYISTYLYVRAVPRVLTAPNTTPAFIRHYTTHILHICTGGSRGGVEGFGRTTLEGQISLK